MLVLPAPAKLNLFLYITGRRTDGYHNLQTLFQFLDYGDTLQFSEAPQGLVTLSPSIDGIAPEQNLIIKAARALQAYSDCDKGVHIQLTKRLPMGGGLGGGSSDAATTLVALNQLWQLNISQTELANIGTQLGADVPVFVKGQAAFAEGTGDILTPVNLNEPWYLVLCPPVSVSTAAIFNDPELPRDSAILSLEQRLTLPWHNDCEALVKKRHPEVAKLLSWLLEYAPSRMTGTGACVFASFDCQKSAEQALVNRPAGVQGFIAKGCNRSPLLTALAS